MPNFPPLLQLRWFYGYQGGGIEENRAASRASNMAGCRTSAPIPHLPCSQTGMPTAEPSSGPWGHPWEPLGMSGTMPWPTSTLQRHNL